MEHKDSFKDWLKNRLEKTLPGESAQYDLAPLRRKEEEFIAKGRQSKPRDSGVMLLLYPNEGMVHIPMIIRNIYKGVHSGQIAFPGGKFEKIDQNLMNTAIRETSEEISVLVSESNIIGQLSTLFVPVSNFLVHPFVAWLDEKPNFIPDQSEVQDILEVSLDYLIDPENIESRAMQIFNGKSINVPGIPIQNRFLWGASAMMMSEFNAIVREFKQ